MAECPICETHGGWPMAFHLDEGISKCRAEAGDTERYFWLLCPTCGNGYPSVPPRTEILNRFWESNRTVEVGGAEAEAEVWQRRVGMAWVGAERSFEVFSPLCPPGPRRMLDVACGLGETVALFVREGFTAEGIDVDAATRPFHERLGITARIGRIEDQALDQSFDLIHIAHAIYFIQEPMKFLSAVRQRLSPNGVFGVVISDFLAATDNSLPGYSHTFYPCLASMENALQRAGLKPIRARRWGGSIFVAARPSRPEISRTNTGLIRAMYATKGLRHAVLGRPELLARRLAKRVLSRSAAP